MAKTVQKRGRGRPKTKNTSSVKTPEELKRAQRELRFKKVNFSHYIYKVLKQVHPDTGMFSKAMSIMDSFVHDLFDRLAAEASSLAKKNKQSTILARDIQSAVRLIIPGELAKHAISEGTKAVTKYNGSR